VSILIDKDTKVLVQGLGKTGQFHTDKAIAYGTQMVGAVHPSKAGTSQVFEGETDESGVKGRADTYRVEMPIFGNVREAVEATGADVSAVYVPPPGAADAIMEAAESGIRLVICITEGIPVADMVRAKRYLAGREARLVGPNCPGVITPEQCKIGIMPGYIHKKGKVGVMSRSGTLTYEAVWQLSNLGLGQSTCVGLGGDPIVGTSFIDLLKLYQADPQTEAILMMGEIGGTAEEEAAAFVKQHVTKPVAAFIAGRTAPKGKRMGHAGAIISGGKGTAAEKIAALEAAGIEIAESPADMGAAMQRAMQRRK
jgi:succinyl-CoA synthetase alpha subunit